ncbi:MAG TPA: hypothetical protein VF699_02980 [Caulobacteraceae bacterium]|jgi:ABC-type phosphate transport system substrate-binding protein
MHARSLLTTLLIAGAAVLALSACGDRDERPEGVNTTTTEPTTGTTTDEAVEPQGDKSTAPAPQPEH